MLIGGLRVPPHRKCNARDARLSVALTQHALMASRSDNGMVYPCSRLSKE
jgi:hypothetical protein